MTWQPSRRLSPRWSCVGLFTSDVTAHTASPSQLRHAEARSQPSTATGLLLVSDAPAAMASAGPAERGAGGRLGPGCHNREVTSGGSRHCGAAGPTDHAAPSRLRTRTSAPRPRHPGASRGQTRGPFEPTVPSARHCDPPPAPIKTRRDDSGANTALRLCSQNKAIRIGQLPHSCCPRARQENRPGRGPLCRLLLQMTPATSRSCFTWNSSQWPAILPAQDTAN